MNNLTDALINSDTNGTLSCAISNRNEHNKPDLCRQCASIDLDSIANGHSSKQYRLRYLVSNRGTCGFCDFVLFCLQRQGASLAITVPSSIEGDKRCVLLHHVISETRSDLVGIRIILQDDRTSFGANITRLDGYSNGRPLIPVTILFPDYIDVERVRGWAASCYSTHEELCGMRAKAGAERFRALKDFRVIDCDAKIVIPLPEGCDYVALRGDGVLGNTSSSHLAIA